MLGNGYNVSFELSCETDFEIHLSLWLAHSKFSTVQQTLQQKHSGSADSVGSAVMEHAHHHFMTAKHSTLYK